MEILRKNRTAILLYFVIHAFQLAVFHLYGIMIEPLLYASVVSLFLLVGGFSPSTMAENVRPGKAGEQ